MTTSTSSRPATTIDDGRDERDFRSRNVRQCQTSIMSRVDEIEQAINQLPPEDFRRLAEWVRTREQRLWDDQMDRDASVGNLDFLIEEAKAEGRTAQRRSSS